jgi:hypothetical protein
MSTHRQAFKNGASVVLARALVHGLEAILPWSDDVAAMMFLAPMADYMRRLHPEWTELHADCVIMGGFAMITVLLAIGRPLLEAKKEIEAFGGCSG